MSLILRRTGPVIAASTLAVGATLSCSPAIATRVPPAPTLTESLNAQIAKAEAMPWTLARRLNWKDFRGDAPRDSGAAAETAYTLFYGVRCAGETFEFRVVAAFRPNDSWVRPSVLKSPTDSARALRHEQTHFDLSEVHARRMRRYFSELMAPCRRTADELAAMAERLVQDERAAQAQYDQETDHSRRSAEQARWDKEVSTQLSVLGRYVK